MRRGKSKNSKRTTTVKWLLMINHKCMHTISFSSCLLRKARKDSSAYSQNFLHAISKDKARQDLSERSFFFHQINIAGKEQLLPSILKSRFRRSHLAQWLLRLLQTVEMHFELCTWGAPCVVKVYALVSRAQAGEERTAFSIPTPAEVKTKHILVPCKFKKRMSYPDHLLHRLGRLQLPVRSVKHQYAFSSRLKGSQRSYEVCEVIHGVGEVEREAKVPIPINALCCQDKCWDSFHLTTADGTTRAWVMPGGGGVEGTREGPWECNALILG